MKKKSEKEIIFLTVLESETQLPIAVQSAV